MTAPEMDYPDGHLAITLKRQAVCDRTDLGVLPVDQQDEL
jgi:hypothetical protein